MITTLETRDGAPWRADWAPRALPWIVAANGVSTLLSALLVHLPERLALLCGILPLEVQSGSRTLSVVTGFLLILLARGLARRKRQAWLATLALLTVSAAAHVLKGLNVEEAGLALLLALLLWALRADYQARSDPPSVLRGYVALAAGLLLAFAYSYSGLFLLHDQFSTPHTWSGAAHASLSLLTFHRHAAAPPYLRTRQAAWFLSSVLILSATALIYGGLMILRPVVQKLFPGS